MDWETLGVGGLVVVFVIRELFAFLKTRGNGNGSERALELDKERKTREQIRELYLAHLGSGARDDDGVFRWYMRDSTVRAIESTAQELREHTRLLKKIAGEQT